MQLTISNIGLKLTWIATIHNCAVIVLSIHASMSPVGTSKPFGNNEINVREAELHIPLDEGC